eukprot:c17723_g1_i1 orf=2-406(-)
MICLQYTIYDLLASLLSQIGIGINDLATVHNLWPAYFTAQPNLIDDVPTVHNLWPPCFAPQPNLIDDVPTVHNLWPPCFAPQPNLIDDVPTIENCNRADGQWPRTPETAPPSPRSKPYVRLTRFPKHSVCVKHKV